MLTTESTSPTGSTHTRTPSGSTHPLRTTSPAETQAQRVHTMANTLRILRVVLHVSFALLLGLAIVRWLVLEGEGELTGGIDSGRNLPVTVVGLLLALAVGGLYLVGTVAEKRGSQQGIDLPRRMALWWLLAVLLGWAALVWLSGEFAWIVFPLFFVVLHLLRRPWGWLVVLVLALYVGAALWQHAAEPSFSVWLGPILGAFASAVIYWIYSLLFRVSTEQAQAIAELEATRSALAESQHEAGRIAERERLARDIHDTLAQGFSSIVLMSRSTANALERGEHELAQQRLKVIETTASENLTEARAFVGKLSDRSAPVELVDALTSMVAGVSQTAQAAASPTDFTFHTDEDLLVADPRIARELLNSVRSLASNVLTHARADHCVITLSAFPGAYVVDIFDDGVGFTPSSPPIRSDGSGFGMRSVKERMEALGGTMSVESAPGEGTVVTLTIPERTAE